MQKVARFFTVLLGTFSLAGCNAMYVGGQLGQTNTHNLDRTITTVNGPKRISPDNKGAGVRLFLGNDATKYLGYETGFSYFSPSKYDLPSNAGVSSPKINTMTMDVMGKARYKFAHGFGVFGKAGAALVYTRTPRCFIDSSESCSAKKNKFRVRPAIGFGGTYNLTPNLEVELAWSRILKSGEFQKADMVAIGLTYHFGDTKCGQFLC